MKMPMPLNCLRLLHRTKSFYIQVRNNNNNNRIGTWESFQPRTEPELYYSLQERLDEKDKKLIEPEKYAKIDIGFSCSIKKISVVEKSKIIKALKNDQKLEKQSRKQILKVDLEAVEKKWSESLKPFHIKELAEIYQIYEHLFGEYAYFYPVVNMKITYDYDEESVSPVYFGNLLKPKETKSIPNVEFESNEQSLWTLILTNPDGNLFENESELIHWFVGNIPGGEVQKGEEIIDYIRPIPPKGTGFHRYCFVLYKQNGRIDFSKYRRSKPCFKLNERTFKTYNFYKEFETDLTPAGLSWFQADYDETLIDFFHKSLEMKNPIYEYEFPKAYVKHQEFFPHLRPFNRYLDLHRDPKELQKIMLLKRLKNVHPFQGEKPLLEFPQALPVPRDWSIWQKNEIKNERDGIGKYRDMYRGDDRPTIYEGRTVTKVFPFKPLK